jgi:predicted NAD/FAD-dependent oxidoreductase
VRCERRFRAAVRAVREAGRVRVDDAAPRHTGEREASRRFEDFHPLGGDARRRALARALARLEADPTPGGS